MGAGTGWTMDPLVTAQWNICQNTYKKSGASSHYFDP